MDRSMKAKERTILGSLKEEGMDQHINTWLICQSACQSRCQIWRAKWTTEPEKRPRHSCVKHTAKRRDAIWNIPSARLICVSRLAKEPTPLSTGGPESSLIPKQISEGTWAAYPQMFMARLPATWDRANPHRERGESLEGVTIFNFRH